MKPCKNNPTNRYYVYDLVVATKIEEITEAKFDQMLEEQAPQYKKWGDLEIKKIYVVTDTTIVSTKTGDSMVLTLKNGAVWAPGHLKKRVIEKIFALHFI